MEEPWTIGRLLGWTTPYFAKQGCDTPRLDAEILLAAALGVKRIELYTRFDSVPGEPQRTVFRDYVKRHGAGEPVAYLVGHKEFFSLPFKVNRETLIPRPETELLVVEAIDRLGASTGTSERRVADVGTGSGCIAVAIAKNSPNCRVTAIDISPAALEIAAENARTNGVAERIEWVQGDLFDAASDRDRIDFDLIVSNPPYVSAAEYERLPPNVKNYEPRTALLAGPTGTETIIRLIPEAWERLKPGGTLLLELSPMIAAACADRCGPDQWENVRVLKDGAGWERILTATKPATTP